MIFGNRPWFFRLLPATTALLLTFCSALSCAAVMVTQGYVRAPVPGQTTAAAFMTIANDGDKPVQLVAVKGDVATALELHGHTHANGIMQMRKVDAIPVPAKARVELAPGGLHLMLIGLRQPLVEKQQVVFTLVFDDGSEVRASMPVVSIMNEAAAGHQHHH